MKLRDLGLPKSEIIRIADEWVWNTRNKEILIKKLEGMTYEEIAEEYNLSTVRLKEIVKECYNKIMRHL